MTEPDRNEIMDAVGNLPPDLDALIASLRIEGVGQFDPVGLYYVEILAKRAAAQHGSVKRMLDTRLAQAIAMLKERFDLARHDAKQALELNVQKHPHVASEMQRLFAAGKFKELRQLITTLKPSEPGASLRVLVSQLERHFQENTHTGLERNISAYSELKAIRDFRNTWSKLSVGKQVAQALEQAPKNAGPINSHMLVLRSLALMREISPDYLNRFMSYADTLLCLDQGEKEKPGNSKKQQVARGRQKIKG